MCHFIALLISQYLNPDFFTWPSVLVGELLAFIPMINIENLFTTVVSLNYSVPIILMPDSLED